MIGIKLGFILMAAVTVPLAVVVNLIRKRKLDNHVIAIIIVTYFTAVVAVTFFPIPIHERLPGGNGWHEHDAVINLKPLASIMDLWRDDPLREFLKNVIGNVLLFLPFGMIASCWRINKNKWITLCFGVLISCDIEIVQLFLSDAHLIMQRTADVDDVLLNVTGFALGQAITPIVLKRVSKPSARGNE
ncbi:VanZ family protein [Paenibacillus glycinis]|uniref:VanZ-like domain-containing protein n=1 Tax=Paenibacillus glycinis TaxID=2697035 RepID=A0ABW9XNI8_9BACL|nr:VanZ family protein [Paenibacillus glycinis]NBD24197.1 hypothetical protein [Paenibacillus glycinis]